MAAITMSSSSSDSDFVFSMLFHDSSDEEFEEEEAARRRYDDQTLELAEEYQAILDEKNTRNKRRRTATANKKPSAIKRIVGERDAWKKSAFWTLYNPDTRRVWTDRKSAAYTEFRHRFVMPYEMVEWLVTALNSDGALQSNYHTRNHNCAPVFLLLLCALRMDSRDWTYDDCEEASFISASTIYRFYHRFHDVMATKLFSKLVRPPRTKAEVLSCMSTYPELPGCCLSADCVHRGWDKCPAGWRSSHEGRYACCTRSYEASCIHNLLILSMTTGHPGTRNDKTIIKFDDFLENVLRTDPVFTETEYELEYCDEVGDVKTLKWKGAYGIVDGGVYVSERECESG